MLQDIQSIIGADQGYDNYEAEQFMWGLFDEAPFKNLGISVLEVESFGGEEQGSNYYQVYRFSREGDPDVYIRFYGYYASYTGANYSGYKVVTPKIKTLTVYE